MDPRGAYYRVQFKLIIVIGLLVCDFLLVLKHIQIKCPVKQANNYKELPISKTTLITTTCDFCKQIGEEPPFSTAHKLHNKLYF